MRTSTSARSTRRHTPALAERHRNAPQRRPLRWAALLLFAAAVTFGACDDGDKPAATPTVPPDATAPPRTPTAEPSDDLASLIGPRADLPANDAIALAARYGVTDGPASSAKPFAGEPEVGDSREFVVVRINGEASAPAPTTVAATLLAKSEHAYFYADDALGATAANMQASAGAFENETWTVVTNVFGEPPSPGVDNDPRIVVLQADLGGVGGYHNADDLYLRAVRPLSNEAELVYIDASNPAGGASFDVVLAHELQPLIMDRNALGVEVWVNEGLSITAEGLVGGAGSVIDSFEEQPSTQLNRWEFSNARPHYGAAGAFLRYLADRFGGDSALGRMAAVSGDGPAGIDEFLAEAEGGVPFASAFADWITANALNRPEGAYANPSRSIDVFIERSLAEGDSVETAAAQFGTDYYELSGITGGEYVLRFDGEPEVEALPVSPSNGGAFFWSNTGDAINTTLTREISVGDTTSLRFSAWYDIEQWYDRGYVSVSADGGETWQALPSTSTTTDDPVRLAYGPGFDGRSGDPSEPRWIDETVDLGAYAGQTVQIRFELVTDGGTHGEGWAVRDIGLEEHEDTNVELDEDGWTVDGWVLIDRTLPQTYVVRLIGERADGDAVALDVPLDQNADGELRFDTNSVTNLLLAVAGTAEGTNVRAPYTITLERP